MRLRRLREGHALRQRLQLGAIRLMSRREAPDVVKMLKYRVPYLGRQFSPLTHEVLRGPSRWSVGERELFAAFVSGRNRCRF